MLCIHADPSSTTTLWSINSPQRKVIIENIESITAASSKLQRGKRGGHLHWTPRETWTPDTVNENYKMKDTYGNMLTCCIIIVINSHMDSQVTIKSLRH